MYITDANIYDAISISVPKSFNQQVITISLELIFYPCFGFNKYADIILPSNVATWVNVRFIANIKGLKSGTSQTAKRVTTFIVTRVDQTANLAAESMSGCKS